ncbi:MAG: PD-(D/E)XK nuclease family protein [Deltaproteobacteria bacterium]
MTAPHPRSILELAGSGTTIVTPTAGLARQLRRRVAVGRRLAGTAIAATPDIVSVQAWLGRLWESGDPQEVLLGRTAEMHLWGAAVADDAEGILDAPALARSAAQAWQLMHDWGPLPEPGAFDTPETEAFRTWSASVTERLASEAWLTSSQLCGRVIEQLEDGRVDVSSTKITLAGFDVLSPVLTELLGRLEARGASILHKTVDAGTTSVGRALAFDSIDDECAFIANDIRRAMETDPTVDIGLALADPELYDRPLARELGQTLFPTTPSVGGLGQSRSVTDTGLAAHALDLLSLREHGNGFALISRVLLSPYPRQETGEAGARARTEVTLRRYARGEIGLGVLKGLLEERGAADSAKRIANLSERLARRPAHASAAQWAESFAVSLRDDLGWPGSNLSDNERAAYRGWREAFAELSSLEGIAGQMSCNDALAIVGTVASETTVEPLAVAAGLTVAGLEDCAALAFNRLYVVGLSATVLPRPAVPHPLLPVRWQRERGLPHASPEISAEAARRLWATLSCSSPETTASYARIGQAEEAQQPSPLIGMPAQPQTVDLRPWYLPEPEARTKQLEPTVEEDVPPAVVRSGGTSLLTDFSDCPFKALAAHRLGAAPLEEPRIGTDAADRGTLVHASLAHAWSELESSERLRALSAAELVELARRSAKRAIGELRAPLPAHLRAPLLDWLSELSAAWLGFEAGQRLGHWRVVARESEAEVELGNEGVRLSRLRIDRTDELPDGRRVLLDYKTGQTPASPAGWLGPRPREPQMPAYVLARLAAGENVAGAGFAQLSARDELAIKASPEVSLLAGRPPRDWPGWDEAIEMWHETLGALADSYALGRAAVQPRAASVCRHCQRQPLCRLFETSVANTTGEDA